MTRREKITQSATELFAKQGYDYSSTKAIAERAGVSEGLVFRHYTSKEGLLKAIVVEGMKQVAETLKPLVGLGENDNAVALHLKLTVDAVKQNQTFWKLVHTLRFDERVKNVLGEEMEKSREYITNILKGYFKRIGRPNPKAEAQLYFAMVDGIVMHYLENPTRYPLADVVNQLKTHYHEPTTRVAKATVIPIRK